MAFIGVKLRIVGLYFNAPVELDDKGKTLSIKDVMDAYTSIHQINEIGGLTYTTEPDDIDPNKSLLLSVSHNFSGRFDFDGNGSILNPADGLSLNGTARAAGVYTLASQFLGDGKSILTWQYYVTSKTGRLKSKTKPTRGFENFASPMLGTDAIEDGDTILWRLIAIVAEPNGVIV